MRPMNDNQKLAFGIEEVIKNHLDTTEKYQLKLVKSRTVKSEIWQVEKWIRAGKKILIDTHF